MTEGAAAASGPYALPPEAVAWARRVRAFVSAPAWFDLWCITKDAPHLDNAYKFINYLLDPEVIAKCTNFTNYAHANVPGLQFTDKAVLDDPAVFPTAEIKAKLWTPKTLSNKLERARTRAWTKIKTG